MNLEKKIVARGFFEMEDGSIRVFSISGLTVEEVKNEAERVSKERGWKNISLCAKDADSGESVELLEKEK